MLASISAVWSAGEVVVLANAGEANEQIPTMSAAAAPATVALRILSRNFIVPPPWVHLMAAP
ncbi:hypothetical protein NQ166_08290 [Microbacterium sp. zg.Y1090]|uniref:hypothetical protein n=1 Tax=Microbacterium wangruii TaxID=3049073 RepID=UPI00214D24EE|nr:MULTISPECIES: hypothetical protein [unclassified Microbacterium]MCR2818828.1 hypothetical protein [Microbacterium sp. zg.Y1090]MDL5486919.1 hypothetical protein [Microbacterium sp. zg-Y1211]WIM27141.1 hypothetical protein QNO26_08100 [Microbacterium sp. zg-Y1090]